MSDSVRDTPMWLSHHWPEHYERCVRLGGRHVCRRCLALYPLAALTVFAVVLLDPPEQVLVVSMWLLPAPMAAEWGLEHLGRIRYSAPRQIALTTVGAPALGAALAIHARHPFSVDAVAPVLWWFLVCGLVAVVAAHRSGEPDPTWESRHDAEEDARQARLRVLLERDEQLPSSG